MKLGEGSLVRVKVSWDRGEGVFVPVLGKVEVVVDPNAVSRILEAAASGWRRGSI